MMAWAGRHPIVAWAIAWATTGMGLFGADVFSSPRRGPLWVAIVSGLLGWGLAGAATLHRRRVPVGVVVWGAAYLAAFWSAAVLGDWFEHHTVGPLSSAGFVGGLLGWAAGGAVGALASACLRSSPWGVIRPVTFALAWGLGFLVAGFVGVTAGLILAQAAKAVLGFLGNQQVALTVGWGLGCALGGLIAASIGMAAHRVILGSSSEAAV
jgi:hypothetical protein